VEVLEGFLLYDFLLYILLWRSYFDYLLRTLDYLYFIYTWYFVLEGYTGRVIL